MPINAEVEGQHLDTQGPEILAAAKLKNEADEAEEARLSAEKELAYW